MRFTKNKDTFRWVMVAIFFGIVLLILWNTYILFQKFKTEERAKMEIWSKAQKELINNVEVNGHVSDLLLQILQGNKTTPMIIAHKNGDYELNNINPKNAQNPAYIKHLIEKFKTENQPLEVAYKGTQFSVIYYGDSSLLKKLKYYPLALLLIIILFGAVIYFFYKSHKNAIQNKLWSGIAKETAHQIGTPLSSLIGWVEILKTNPENTTYIPEIQKDIRRLQTITERFSKIGSVPILKPTNIVQETTLTYDYLKIRSSKLIDFKYTPPEHPVVVNLNKQLYSWVIENLIKNAIDAMRGKGTLLLEVLEEHHHVKIIVTDNGKGIAKKYYSRIFEPGYTTKKRGWGLGLSLTKRIVEDFHKGSIKVLRSEINKGTAIQVTLKRIL